MNGYFVGRSYQLRSQALLTFLPWSLGRTDLANWCWAGGTAPVVIGLLISIIRDLLAGRVGVDAVAFVSMSGALALGQNLAGIVIAVMYAGGNILEDLPSLEPSEI